MAEKECPENIVEYMKEHPEMMILLDNDMYIIQNTEDVDDYISIYENPEDLLVRILNNLGIRNETV